MVNEAKQSTYMAYQQRGKNYDLLVYKQLQYNIYGACQPSLSSHWSCHYHLAILEIDSVVENFLAVLAMFMHHTMRKQPMHGDEIELVLTYNIKLSSY